jgi:hypothetical protein
MRRKENKRKQKTKDKKRKGKRRKRKNETALQLLGIEPATPAAPSYPLPYLPHPISYLLPPISHLPAHTHIHA